MSTVSVVLPVLAPTPFLRAMTEFAIKTLRAHADSPFELVVVEAEGAWFDPKLGGAWKASPSMSLIDKYLTFTPRQGSTKDFNAGAYVAAGEFIVSTGNDVFAPPHWDTEQIGRASCRERV